MGGRRRRCREAVEAEREDDQRDVSRMTPRDLQTTGFESNLKWQCKSEFASWTSATLMLYAVVSLEAPRHDRSFRFQVFDM